MIYNKKRGLTLAVALMFGVGSTVASAGFKLDQATYTVPVAGGPVVIKVLYDGDGVTTAIRGDIQIDTTKVAFDSAANLTASALCSLSGGNRLRTQESLPSTAPIPDSELCSFSLIAQPGADGDTLALGYMNLLFVDIDSNDTSASHANVGGEIVWQAAPPDIVIDFDPSANLALTAPAGTLVGGSSNILSIAASVASGTIGTGTVSNCSFPAGSNFSVSGAPLTVPPGGNLQVQATLTNAAQSATLTCDVLDGNPQATTQHTWTVTAPAGSAPPTPGSLPGGAQASSGLGGSAIPAAALTTSLQNVGGLPIDYTCSITPAVPGFSIASGASGSLVGGASAPLTLAPANYPADGVTTTVTVECSWDPGVPSATYTFSFTGRAAAAAPTFIPATSLWSKLALFGVFAALGMLVLGLRRNH